MHITVRLFAMLREQAGWRERLLELPDGATIDDAWQSLVSMIPTFARHREAVRFARNRVYSSASDELADGDELAVIPPVAGGSDQLVRVELSADPISDDILADLRRTLPTHGDGAFVVFVGQTRETPGTPAPNEIPVAPLTPGAPVEALEYEAFAEMAMDVFRAIAAEIEQRFDVRRLAIIHRTGRVPLGEASVVVAASAAHRSAAIDAARYAIDELKARAPIWKSEAYADGSVWIGSPAREGPVREA